MSIIAAMGREIIKKDIGQIMGISFSSRIQYGQKNRNRPRYNQN